MATDTELATNGITEQHLENLLKSYEVLRATLPESHPKVQFAVGQFRTALRAYEQRQGRMSPPTARTTAAGRAGC